MGNILITQEGVETSTIQEGIRDKSLFSFYEMINKAVDDGDKCFMLETAYQHTYSYGDYFPAFVNLSWDEFKNKKSLNGVSYNTYNYITNNCQNCSPSCIVNEIEFEQKRDPRGFGGFEHTDSSEDFLCNLAYWKRWHIKYLTSHPEDIQWDKNHSFIPNINAVHEILEEEIINYIRKENIARINAATNKEKEINKIKEELFDEADYHINEDITQPLKINAIALLFHRVVMASFKHTEMTAYCREIGKKVCEVNYYQHEKDLSNKEQQHCKSLRCIYSITKNGQKQYISLDFHKGMFEFHDESGRHLGEFLFDGTWNKKAEESHNFKTL